MFYCNILSQYSIFFSPKKRSSSHHTMYQLASSKHEQILIRQQFAEHFPVVKPPWLLHSQALEVASDLAPNPDPTKRSIWTSSKSEVKKRWRVHPSSDVWVQRGFDGL